jgi:DNA-binding response OmpR family regulator
MENGMLGLFRTTKALRQVKILVADDDAVVRETLKDQLVHQGWDILTACDGHEALGAAIESRPDMILMDIGMPTMDGLTALEYLRRDPGVSGTLVMMITCSDRVGDITRAASWDVVDYVTKPFSAAELAARIKRVLKRRNLQ